jgi:hypothetical protein
MTLKARQKMAKMMPMIANTRVTIIRGRAIVVVTFSGIPSGGTPSASIIIIITVYILQGVSNHKYTYIPGQRVELLSPSM